MARIDVLPSIEIIRGLKGILDFYVWRGLPCVRAWPTWRPTRQTDASKAAALTFGAIVKAYALLANHALLAYREDALDQPRTARDIMVTGVYGNLHEASMSDFLDALIIIRDGVVALTDLLHALDSIDTDEIVVNVDQSVLPPLAATTTNQATAITALQKIDDLQDALESKALDRLLVRGMDQLFSLYDSGRSYTPFTATGATHTLDAPAVPPDQYWIVTTIAAYNSANNSGALWIEHLQAGTGAVLKMQEATIKLRSLDWSGWVVLKENDFIRAVFRGLAIGDTLRLATNYFIMTLET